MNLHHITYRVLSMITFNVLSLLCNKKNVGNNEFCICEPDGSRAKAAEGLGWGGGKTTEGLGDGRLPVVGGLGTKSPRS